MEIMTTWHMLLLVSSLNENFKPNNQLPTNLSGLSVAVGSQKNILNFRHWGYDQVLSMLL